MTSARTKLLGVLGSPIDHSRSPAIHTAAIEALGIDAAYLAFAVTEAELPSAIHGLRALGALGGNVTVPHKERVLPLLDRIEPAAKAVGAVNTIVFEAGAAIGTNTDAAGLARSLHEAGVALDGARVLVVGAGGAARAAVVGLSDAGAARVDVAARRIASAERIAKELGAHALDLGDAAALRAAAGGADLLVQATSATLHAEQAASFAAALPIAALPDHATVCDLVYAPRETAVLEAARARGLRTVDGLGMLVWQAALSFERWFGVAAPIDAMRRAAERQAVIASPSSDA